MIKVTAHFALVQAVLTPLAAGGNDGGEEHKDAGTVTIALSKGIAVDDLHTVVANTPHLQRRACRLQVDAGRAGTWDGYAQVGGVAIKPPKDEGGASKLTLQVRVEDDQPNLHALMSLLLQHLDLGGGVLLLEFVQHDEVKATTTPPLPFGEAAPADAEVVTAPDWTPPADQRALQEPLLRLLLDGTGGLLFMETRDVGAACCAAALWLGRAIVGQAEQSAHAFDMVGAGALTNPPADQRARMLDALRTLQMITLPEGVPNEVVVHATNVLEQARAVLIQLDNPPAVTGDGTGEALPPITDDPATDEQEAA